MSTRRSAITPELLKTARALARRPGVIGVFFGNGSAGGKWVRKECLVVHVMRKVHALHLSIKQQLPEKVDVIQVGTPRAHALEVADEVVAPGAGTRAGTFTALLETDDGARALLSGHVALPCTDRRIVRSYDYRYEPAFGITAVDGAQDQVYQGNLIRGGISTYSDWGIAVFPDATGKRIDPIHPLVHARPPFPIRTTPLNPGEPVRHFSRVTGREHTGTFQHEAVSATKPVWLPDGTQRTYSGLLGIAADGGWFSQHADSGSLVCDAAGLALGTILAGTENGKISYVLPIVNLTSPLGSDFGEFFHA